jgi:glucose/arabinose dehydrogenase
VTWVYLPPDTCLETIIDGLTTDGMMSVGGLAFTPDGTLYLARPALRQVWRMRPDDERNFLPPEVFAADLPEPPLGLAYDPVSGAWFTSMDSMIARLTDADADGQAEVRVIVEGLPGGVGGWLGDVRIGPDRRLYVAKAASCDACLEADSRRAALLSFALDGRDPRIEARGLRSAFGFDWSPTGTLYIVDHERQDYPAELNVIPAGQRGLDFGWPHCAGDRLPVPGVPGATTDHCSQTVPPVLAFDSYSQPTGVLYYQGSAFPQYHGLWVAFAGSWNHVAVNGHEVRLVRLGTDERILGVERLIPHSALNTSDASLIKTSLHPYRPYALVVGPDGWVYLSIAEGRVYRFRI